MKHMHTYIHAHVHICYSLDPDPSEFALTQNATELNWNRVPQLIYVVGWILSGSI